MKTLVTILASGLVALGSIASAEGDLTRADIQKVVLEMGSNDDGMYFAPNTFKFETGRAYDLVLVNVDAIKHELSIGEMAERIFTRKLEVKSADGETLIEVKGRITEVEVGANQTVEWFFVPVQTMEPSAITCEIPGHKEAGMHGTAEIF